jgi:hypothetical protein
VRRADTDLGAQEVVDVVIGPGRVGGAQAVEHALHAHQQRGRLACAGGVKISSGGLDPDPAMCKAWGEA